MRVPEHKHFRLLLYLPSLSLSLPLSRIYKHTLTSQVRAYVICEVLQVTQMTHSGLRGPEPVAPEPVRRQRRTPRGWSKRFLPWVGGAPREGVK